MNPFIKTLIFYTIIGLISGLFYREFTKLNGVDGGTALVFIHTHTLMLGMFIFLILSLFEEKLNISSHKHFKLFSISYHIGLMTTIASFLTRGIIEVLALDISTGLNASLSGIAGIGHISLSLGLLTILFTLYKSSKINTESSK